MAVFSPAARPDLVRRAFRLEWLTAGWLLIEAAVAIGSGVAAHSLTLIAFGADSIIELVSAGVLLWRLNVELRHGAEFPASVEHRASRFSAALLFALAAYVVMNAAYGLWRREGQEFSTSGLAIAVLAIPIMWWLARAKMRVATSDRQPRTSRRCRRVDHLRLPVRRRGARVDRSTSHAGLVVGR